MPIFTQKPRMCPVVTAVWVTALVCMSGCRKHPVAPPATVTETAPATHGAFRVVCWNIEWFPGKSSSASPDQQALHVEEIRGALEALQPDILLAQEIRSDAPLMETLSAVPGHKLGVISRFSGAQQTVTTGRIPIVAAWFERWERDGRDDPPRGFSTSRSACRMEACFSATTFTSRAMLEAILRQTGQNVRTRSGSFLPTSIQNFRNTEMPKRRRSSSRAISTPTRTRSNSPVRERSPC